MAKRRGLGGGLENLIPQTVKTADIAGAKLPEGQVVQSINITKIEPNKAQARKKFDEDKLAELTESIRQHGVISPILVIAKGDRYEIVAGERRWRAAHKAELKEIPAIILDINNMTKQEIDEISLIENIQRENLNPIEEAHAYKQLIDDYGLKQDEVAERVSKSRTAITNSMRLLKLSSEVQQMLIDEMLTTGHARALIPVEDQEQQKALAQQIFDESLSVRDVEKLVKSLGRPKKPKKTKDHNLETVYRGLEEELTQALGTRVVITGDGSGAGKIEVDFYNGDDLEKITDRLRKQA